MENTSIMTNVKIFNLGESMTNRTNYNSVVHTMGEKGLWSAWPDENAITVNGIFAFVEQKPQVINLF